jgi:hypothetical protein
VGVLARMDRHNASGSQRLEVKRERSRCSFRLDLRLSSLSQMRRRIRLLVRSRALASCRVGRHRDVALWRSFLLVGDEDCPSMSSDMSEEIGSQQNPWVPSPLVEVETR